MNENPDPTQEPIKPPEIPAQCPNNPYRTENTYAEVAGPRGAERAKGFDGDLLDSILKTRMLEGMRVGYDDGNAQAAKAYGTIYDEAWRLGVGEGFTSGYGAVMTVSVPALEASRKRLEAILKETGSTKIKQECAAGIDEINATFGRL